MNVQFWVSPLAGAILRMFVYAEAAAPGIPRHIGSADGGWCHCALRGTLRLRLARPAIGNSAGKAQTDDIKDVWYGGRRKIQWRWRSEKRRIGTESASTSISRWR